MMEAWKWKTTRKVTRNTCDPEHHLEEFTGSKFDCGTFFCFRRSTR